MASAGLALHERHGVSYDSSIIEDTDTGSEECERQPSLVEILMPHPLRKAMTRFTTYTMQDLSRSVLMRALSIWHAYLFWVATCVLFAISANELLRWWIRWYTKSKLSKSYVAAAFEFFSVQAKSFIWIAVLSDLIRHSLLLAWDAFRSDAFEAYRRTVLGEALEDVAIGQLYAGAYRPSQGKCRRRAWDYVMQVLLYTSLDIFPLSVTVWCKITSGDTVVKHSLGSGLFYVTYVALAHTLLFYIARTVTDAALKWNSFWDAWRCSKQAPSSKATLLGAVQVSGKQDEEVSSLASRLSMESLDDASGDESLVSDGVITSIAVEQRNLCLRICPLLSALGAFLPQLLWLGAVLVGLLEKRVALVVAGLVWALCYFSLTGGLLTCAIKSVAALCNCEGRESKKLQGLQAWGETRCSLNYDDVLFSRKIVSYELVMFGNLVAYVEWWGYTIAFMLGHAYLCVRQAAFFVERPWGWLIGWLEGILFHLLAALSVAVFQSESRWKDCGLVLALSAARLFSLQTPLSAGLTLKWIAWFVLVAVEFVIVAIIVMTIQTAGEADGYSAFCNPSWKNCSVSSFPFFDAALSVWPQCSLRFPRRDGAEPLTLPEFGLFSTLAYEGLDTVEYGLQQYFPGWHVEDSHFTTSPALRWPQVVKESTSNLDWTTFYQFSSNGTSVFAVRGTQYLIDVLQDIDLWLPAVIIKAFTAVGPDFHEKFMVAIAELTTTGRRESEKIAFKILLDRVRWQMTAHPDRIFYITGHSLGGGIAKLVAAQISSLNPELRLPAITFAAPALGATGFVVYGKDVSRNVAKTSLTVQPENDIVSRIDSPADSIVPVACSGNILQCHSIMNSLCSIYATCGSLRYGQNVTLYTDCNKFNRRRR